MSTGVVPAEVLGKQVAKDPRIWYEAVDGRHSIGFTKEFLEIVHDCWHVSPATWDTVAVNSPLLTVETTDALFTIKSPLGGDIINFNSKAQNFPDQLTEDDVICHITPKGKTKRAAPVSPEQARQTFGQRMVVNNSQSLEEMRRAWEISHTGFISSTNVDISGTAIANQALQNMQSDFPPAVTFRQAPPPTRGSF